MDADVDLDNLKNWAEVAAQAIERILSPELSKPVKLTPSEVDVLAEDVVGAAVPQDGLAIIWSVTKDGTARPVLFAFERDAALALAGLRRDEIDRYATRREETRPFDEDEAFSLAIVGTIIADSMSAPLSEIFKGLEVKSLGPSVVTQGQWTGETVKFDTLCGRTEYSMSWGSADTATARVLIAAPLLAGAPKIASATAPKAAPTAEVVDAAIAAASAAARPTISAAPGQIAAFIVNEDTKKRITEALAPAEVVTVHDLGELVSLWSASDLAGAVVEVAPGNEREIALLAGLHHIPERAQKPFFVILDQPTIDAVISCGRNRLFDVLPGDFEAATLRERWSHR